MKNGPIDQDSHLVGAQVEKYLEAVHSARRGLQRISCGKLKILGDGLLPLENLIVEISNFFDIQRRVRGRRERADRPPDF